MLGALEFYGGHSGVRRVAGGREIVAGADDGQHPAARGDQVVALACGAGVDHVHAVLSASAASTPVITSPFDADAG